MTQINYRRIAGQDTFLARYMDLMEEIETARAYDFWCGLWVLSSLIGRQVYVDRPRLPVRLNLFLLLTAESGVTRKSTAIGAARRLYQDVMHNDMGLTSTKTSPEAMLRELGRMSREVHSSHMAICISELVTFMGREKYTLAVPGMLTDLYDCPEHYRSPGTLAQGFTVLDNVYLTFLSASTPTWLAGAINPDVIEGGFTSRCLFIHEERPKKRIAWPSDEEKSEDTCRSSLQEIVSAARYQYPAIGLHDNAIKRFSRWYKKRDLGSNPFTQSFASREDDHVLCVAGLLAINDRQFKVMPLHIDRAIALIGKVKEDSGRLFAGTYKVDKTTQGVTRVQEVLIGAGQLGIPQSKLYIRVRHLLSKSEFEATLDIMHELEMVQAFREQGESGRPATIWRATRKIRDVSSNEKLRDKIGEF